MRPGTYVAQGENGVPGAGVPWRLFLPRPRRGGHAAAEQEAHLGMVCSTAAKSSMKVIPSRCRGHLPQYLCYRLRQLRPGLGDSLRACPARPQAGAALSQAGWS